jgi:hypothetical protein
MKASLRKFPILCALTCIIAASTLAAASTTTQTAPQSTDPEEARDLFRKDKSVFFVTAEFLYWTVNEGRLDYALKMNRPAWSPTVDSNGIGHFQNADFNWSPGVRITAGYFRAPHYWDMFAEYTYFSSEGRNTSHAPKKEDQFLNGTFSQPDPITTPAIALEEARSQIEFSYQNLNFLMSRRFHPNPHLRLNIFGGLTSALLFQKWKVHYEDVLDQHSKLRNMWKFEGVGLRVGGKVDWYMGWDIYLTGQASTGILSGWYENSSFQMTDAVIPGVNNARPMRDTQYHDKRLVYTSQFMAGPSWQKAFEKVRIEAMVGYEMTIWANVHEIYRTSLSGPTAAKETFVNDSNISLQGFTFRVNVDF